jgi:hypothetical protein
MRMKNLPQLLVTLLPMLASQPSIADTDAAGLAIGLRLSSDTPTVEVKPRNRERAPLVLPDLEFQIQIDAVCADSTTPASLSLGVADTRRSFSSAQILAGEFQTVRLQVPAKQIAPVVIKDFCVSDAEFDNSSDPAGLQLPVTIPAALSAQASFLCVGDNAYAMHYSSTALAVILHCVDGYTPKEKTGNP